MRRLLLHGSSSHRCPTEQVMSEPRIPTCLLMATRPERQAVVNLLSETSYADNIRPTVFGIVGWPRSQLLLILHPAESYSGIDVAHTVYGCPVLR
jgi:hypothetical protein